MENKEISFEYEGAKYTLTFSRRTVQTLTRNGFKLDMISEQPAIGIPMLFRGAFMVHHRNIKDSLTDEIWEKIPNKQDFIGALAEMFADPINTLLGDPDENDEKKVEWGKNF